METALRSPSLRTFPAIQASYPEALAAYRAAAAAEGATYTANPIPMLKVA